MHAASIDLGDGRKLVADVCAADEFKEIYIGIEHADGTYQELCMAGEQYKYNDSEIERLHGNYVVLVWGDEHSEDFTTRIDIKAWEEE